MHKTAKEYIKKAKKGDPEAQYQLGVAYYQCLYGLTRNNKKILYWLIRSALNGHIEAQISLFHIFFYGNLFYCVVQDQDYKEAFKWIMMAAEQNNSYAQFMVGYCYDEQLGVEHNLTKALEWWNKAADQDSKQACMELGRRYEKGEWVEVDMNKAVKYYEKALELGCRDACSCLSDIYKKSTEFVVNPGRLLSNALSKQNKTVDDLVRDTGIDKTIINNIISGTQKINSKLARKLDKALDIDASFWLNAQSMYQERTGN